MSTSPTTPCPSERPTTAVGIMRETCWITTNVTALPPPEPSTTMETQTDTEMQKSGTKKPNQSSTPSHPPTPPRAKPAQTQCSHRKAPPRWAGRAFLRRRSDSPVRYSPPTHPRQREERTNTLPLSTAGMPPPPFMPGGPGGPPPGFIPSPGGRGAPPFPPFPPAASPGGGGPPMPGMPGGLPFPPPGGLPPNFQGFPPPTGGPGQAMSPPQGGFPPPQGMPPFQGGR